MEKKTLRDYGLKCFKLGKYQVFRRNQFYDVIKNLPDESFKRFINNHIESRFYLKDFSKIGFIVIWSK